MVFGNSTLHHISVANLTNVQPQGIHILNMCIYIIIYKTYYLLCLQWIYYYADPNILLQNSTLTLNDWSVIMTEHVDMKITSQKQSILKMSYFTDKNSLLSLITQKLPDLLLATLTNYFVWSSDIITCSWWLETRLLFFLA